MNSPYDLSAQKPRINALKTEKNKDIVALQKDVDILKGEVKRLSRIVDSLTRSQRRTNANNPR
jgi:uncharacterized protein YlxW (UPF0749 family)